MALANGLFFLSLLVHLIANPAPDAEHEGYDQDTWQKVDDMILSPSQIVYLYTPFNNRRNVFIRVSSRWPNGIVPYEFAPDYNEKQRELIRDVLKTAFKDTCIQFRPRNATDTDYIRVVNGENCSSFVGRKINMQELNLKITSCLTRGVITHEFLHALGLVHQHTASNRNNHVTIVWENIKPKNKYNFKQYEHGTSYGQPYDFDSIMHYTDKAFSMNGKPTIIAKYKSRKYGYATELSKIDKIKVNKRYNCKLK